MPTAMTATARPTVRITIAWLGEGPPESVGADAGSAAETGEGLTAGGGWVAAAVTCAGLATAD